jgi:glutathione peroxidase
MITAINALPQEHKSFYDFTVKDIDGNDFNLAKLKGKKVIVVNVASKCGLTPQYKILQELYEKYADNGNHFEIIAFPANNFLRQEPGTESDIKEFCSTQYNITFPLMSKVSVSNYIYKSYPPDTSKADATEKDEIYKWLTEKKYNGVMDTEVMWNFQKFLIDENGNLVGTLPPQFAKEIIYLLNWLKL